MPVVVGGVEQDAARVIGQGGPGYGLFAITPSDDADLVIPARAIYVTVAGNLSGVGFDDEAFGPIALPDNFLLPVGAKRITAAGTTATGIWGIK